MLALDFANVYVSIINKTITNNPLTILLMISVNFYSYSAIFISAFNLINRDSNSLAQSVIRM